ncbi:hypothetical protein ECB98_07985 [Brucellaceae bacterium VT-16-1752]|nr:hypothetical protein ECB98_07985 [Brucellaceae bacterium VT-16-1752]
MRKPRNPMSVAWPRNYFFLSHYPTQNRFALLLEMLLADKPDFTHLGDECGIDFACLAHAEQLLELANG